MSLPGENHSVVSAYTTPYKQKFSFSHSFLLLFVCFKKKFPMPSAWESLIG